MAHKRAAANNAVAELKKFVDHIEETYGRGTLLSVSQSDFTEELLVYLWKRGYKVVPLDQEDYNDH